MPIGRHKLSIFRGLLLLAPVGACLWWLGTRKPADTSDFELALDRALLPVIDQRGAQSKLGASTSTQTRLLARELAVSSVPYLAPRDLELWAELRERVARSSPSACAELWKGADDAFIGNAIAALGEDEVTSYAEMLARGFALRLERKPPPHVPTGALQRGFAAAAGGSSEAERAAFEEAMAQRDVTDAQACRLLLTLSAAVAKLEPAARTDFYRALALELKKP